MTLQWQLLVTAGEEPCRLVGFLVSWPKIICTFESIFVVISLLSLLALAQEGNVATLNPSIKLLCTWRRGAKITHFTDRHKFKMGWNSFHVKIQNSRTVGLLQAMIKSYLLTVSRYVVSYVKCETFLTSKSQFSCEHSQFTGLKNVLVTCEERVISWFPT